MWGFNGSTNPKDFSGFIVDIKFEDISFSIPIENDKFELKKKNFPNFEIVEITRN